jgi:putative DNA primase/helicase
MAATIDPKKLQDDAARERLGADLWNRRLAVCAEAGGQKLEAELLKTLSGSDMLTVRFLYQEAFDALPRHVLLMVSNDAPRLDAYDDALKDRVVALPFVHRLDENGPLELTGGARVEAVRKDPLSPLVCGFAAWAVEGLARVFETQSIFRAACIETATAKFWADTDPLTSFWETLDADELRGGISKTGLRKSYEDWCDDEGVHKNARLNRTNWIKACKAQGLDDIRRTGGKWFWFLVREKVTQVTKLKSFPESPRENIKETHGLCENDVSFVTCVTPGDETGTRKKVTV